MGLSLIVSGCSPFGQNSIIESINNSIGNLFSKTNTADLNSGGEKPMLSVAPIWFENHQIEMTVGNVYQQSSFITAQGHIPEITISGVCR